MRTAIASTLPLLGATFCSQGLSSDGALSLTNALDITIGSH